ncbi:MAG: FCD domain-containing protein [Chloroflexia bacterium]|nr:FCD domain-containing protein [Chloroflexia bacterium]
MAGQRRDHPFYQWDGQLPTGQDVVDHRAIYEAVRDHDPPRARQAMLDHLAGPTVAGRTACANPRERLGWETSAETENGRGKNSVIAS